MPVPPQKEKEALKAIEIEAAWKTQGADAKKYVTNRRFWKTPYQVEYQPVWKTQDSTDGKPVFFLTWSSVQSGFCLCDITGKKLASCDGKNVMWGYDRLWLT